MAMSASGEEWAEVLQDEILAMSSDDRERLGERATKRVRERFGMEAMAADIEDALYDAVSKGKFAVWYWFVLGIVILIGLQSFFVRG